MVRQAGNPISVGSPGDIKTLTGGDGGGSALPHRVLYVTGPGGGARHLLPEGYVSLGRGGESTIVIDDPRVSRTHAPLITGTDLTLTDLGSANGTLLPGHRLKPGEAHQVAPGQTFFTGGSALVVRFTSLRYRAERYVTALSEAGNCLS